MKLGYAALTTSCAPNTGTAIGLAAQIRERAASHLKKPAARSAGFGASCTDPVDGTKSEVGGRDRSTPTCAQVSQFCGGSRGAKGGYHA
jgi:hypothetical protein